MPSELAQRISEARLARGISLEEAERATKIRRRYLEAIEAGDFAQLPDGPPGRGFVRNYARYLGLDPEAAIHLLESEVGVPVLLLQDPAPPPPTRQRQISKYTQLALPEPQTSEEAAESVNGTAASSAVVRHNGADSRTVVSLARPPRATRSSFRLKEIRGPFTRYDPYMLTARGAKQPFSAMPRTTNAARYGLGMLIVIGILALIALLIVPFARDRLSALLPPSPADSRAAPTFVPEVTIFALLPTPTGNPASSPAPAPANPAPAQPPASAAGLKVALDVRERAWVRVRVDGSIVFEGIPPSGLGLPFSAQREISVETGDAGAFEVIVNDVRLGPLGARNETVRRTWSAATP